jgi:hypothetical protein
MLPREINEARDGIRYDYTTGWAHLAAVADQISVLAFEGKLSAAERDQIHDHVREAFGGLDRLYGAGRDQLAIDDDDDDDDYSCCRAYSDDSPVYSTVRPTEQFPSAAVYCGDLGPADELEPGAEVVVALPPHLRAVEVR